MSSTFLRGEEHFKQTKEILKRREHLPIDKLGLETEIDKVNTVIPLWSIFIIYITYIFLVIFGLLTEWQEKISVKLGWEKSLFAAEKGYAPLFKELQYFWLRHCFQRMRNCFERPICSVPSGSFEILDRISTDCNATFQLLGTTSKCLNLGSYNYLGFGENSGPVINQVSQSIKDFSYCASSPVLEAGQTSVVSELEEAVCRFLNKPASMIFGMGFATNSTTIPALGGKGTLVLSDALNHSSLVTGMRDSGSKIMVFRHNNMEDLEMVLRASIVEGMPRSRKPWKKIIIFVEGIYSMEGQICNLPEIAYLYVDEAHSIGCLGTHGRGVCEHFGIPTSDVDILMGTFTKAFGSVGGYIAGSKDLIDFLKVNSYANLYAESMSPPCAMQALAALKMISGEDGTDEGMKRLKRIKENANFFRTSLIKLGFQVIADEDSPVIIAMVYHPAKLAIISDELLARGIAVVVVGFPVTPLLLTRVRFCISSSHTREDLEWAICHLSEIGDSHGLKYNEWKILEYEKKQEMVQDALKEKKKLNKLNNNELNFHF